MTDRELLKEARDLIVMCSLLDKSNQCNEMIDEIDEQLAIPLVSQQRELLIGALEEYNKVKYEWTKLTYEDYVNKYHPNL